MAKPAKVIKKIEGNEIIPRYLQDGTTNYVASLPTLTEDSTIALTKDIPSVSITGADRGLSIVSSKVGHSNTSITAQGTQALYPIKIDTYGHITGYGSAVTSLPANGGNADTVDSLHLNDQAMAFTRELTCQIGIGPGCLAGTMTEAEIFALTGNRYGKYYLASDTNKVYRRHVVVTTASSSNWRNDTTQYNASLSLTDQLQDEPYIYVKVKTGYTYYSKLPKFFVQAGYDNTSGSTTITGYCRQQNKFMINSCNYNGSNILGIYQPTANTDIYYLKLKRYASVYGATNDYSINVKVMTNFNANSNYGLEFIGKDHTEYTAVSGYNYIAIPADGLTCNDVQVINGTSVGASPKFTDANVKYTNTYANANYPVLFKNSNTNNDETGGVRFDSDALSNFYYNPSTNTLKAKNIISDTITTITLNGVTVGNSPKFTDTTYSAGTGLSLAGTTFNHSNNITAQTTQAVYPIKIDAQGHISAYGSAVTIPTVGTLNTNNSTTQTPSSDESFGGTINLHKISKTGSYNDLLDRPAKELYWCTYGTTTYAEITQALTDNKLPMVKYLGITFVYLGIVSSKHYFCSNSDTRVFRVSVNTSDVWGYNHDDFEFTWNKTTSLTPSSTDSQYPSAKATYDAIEDVREVAEGKANTYVCSSVTNPVLNSQDSSVEMTSSLTDINGNTITLNDLKVGDNIYITETDIPDRWVANFGGLPSDYQAVEYIESSGLEYIDTNVVMTTDINIDVDIVITQLQADRFPLGSATTGNMCYMNVDNGATYIRYGNTYPSGTGFIWTAGTRTNIKILNKKWYIDDALQYDGTSVTNIGNLNLHLFCANNKNHIKAKLYKAKIYNSDTLIRNMIPCYRKSDNVVGMYDTINSQFYENASSSGGFTKGSDLSRTSATLNKLETAKVPITSISENGTPLTPINGNVDVTVPTDTIQLTNSAGFITLPQVPTEVFWATYGTTTYNDIHSALQAGKVVQCKYDNFIYICTRDIGSYAYFGCSMGTSSHYLQVSSSNSWASQPVTVEATWNKVTSISSSSTNSQYPSAKLLYDQLALKTDKTDKEIYWVIEGTTTYDDISTAVSQNKLPLLVKNGIVQIYQETNTGTAHYFGSIENTTVRFYWFKTDNTIVLMNAFSIQSTGNLVTSISSSSTHSQYPSAEATYNAIQDVREVAEGKTKSYVGNITDNPILNSQDANVTITSFITTMQETIPLGDFRIGDNIYVTNTDVPDRWVSTINTTTVPTGYTGLQYVLLNETLYTNCINTGLKNNETNKLVMEIKMASSGAANPIFMSTFNGKMSHASPYLAVGSADGFTNVTRTPVYSVSDFVSDFRTQTITFTSSNTGNLSFGAWQDNTWTRAIYIKSLKFYNDGALLRDFKPCINNSTNVVGFYDLITETFFAEASGDPLTAGPQAEPGQVVSVGLSKLETSKVPITSISLNSTPIEPVNSNVDIQAVDLVSEQSITGNKTFYGVTNFVNASQMTIASEVHFTKGGSPTDYAYGYGVGIFGKDMMCNSLYIPQFKFRNAAMYNDGKNATVWNLPNQTSGTTHTIATTDDIKAIYTDYTLEE